MDIEVVGDDLKLLGQWLRTSEHLTGHWGEFEVREKWKKRKEGGTDEKKGDVYGWHAICWEEY